MDFQHLSSADLIELKAIQEARESFWAYRRYLNPKMKLGWFQRDVAKNLQQFADDLFAGKRPILIIEAPPQHGKSIQVIEFISWLAGKNPDLKTIYTSFSERLGIRANLRLQRIYDSERYKKVFPKTEINKTNVVTVSGQYLRNREILEYVRHEGYFRNTTVRGSITGESLDIGVVDDPIKGREEAKSETIREKTWEWFTDDFFSRFSEDAGMLIILTRWHLDDPVGRLIESNPNNMRLLKYRAIADKDEPHRKAGEALFPEHKSLDFLLERKKLMGNANFSALYQQSPIIEGGGLFKVHNAKFLSAEHLHYAKIVRYWDKAGTEGGGAYTAGVKMAKLKDGRFVVLDVVRGQWSALERENRIKQTAIMDGVDCLIWVEQEPGSGGKESAEATIRNLSGFVVKAERVTGDKETRAEPYAAQMEAGNVSILVAEWNKSFLTEHENFPNGLYKDQVDASAGAFNKIADVGKQARVY